MTKDGQSKRLAGTERAENALKIELHRIVPDLDQPRQEFDKQALASLAESLKSQGQLQPIRVRYDEGRDQYVIIAGERRWRAAQIAGLGALDCMVDEQVDRNVLLAQLTENSQREDLNYIERAKAYRRLQEMHGWNIKELAEHLGDWPQAVGKVLKCLGLPQDVQAYIASHRVNIHDIGKLSAILNPHPNGRGGPRQGQTSREQSHLDWARFRDRYADILQAHGVEPEIPDPEEQLQADAEAMKWRAKFNELNRKYKASLQKLDVLMDNYETITSLPDPESMQFAAAIEGATGDAGAVLILSDWHIGQLVEPSMTGGKNEYSLDIFRQRVEALWQNAIRMLRVARGLSNIDELVVCVLGDMISGHIHEDAAATNEVGTTSQLQIFGDYLFSGLEYLDQHADVRRTRVICHYGNHSRVGKEKRILDAPEMNLEYLQMCTLAQFHQAQHPDVSWEVIRGPDGVFELKGHRIRAQHGDSIRYAGGVLGVGVPVAKAIDRLNKADRVDYDLMGHYHQSLRWPDACMCGSLVGYDAFAKKKMLQPDQPCQTLVVFDRHHQPGPVFCEPVFVKPVQQEEAHG